MFPVTTNFKNKCDDPQAIPQKKFTFNKVGAGAGGTASWVLAYMNGIIDWMTSYMPSGGGGGGSAEVDYSDKLLNMGSFNQLQYEGDDLTGSDLTVDLLNDSKEFNFLKTDKTNIGQIGTLKLGFPNAAAQFDGSTGYVTIPSSAGLNPTGDFSVESWFKSSGNAETDGRILTKRDATAAYELYLETTGGIISGYILTPIGSLSISASGNWADGLIHYIVLTRQNTTLTIFIDGVERSSNVGPTGSVSNTSPVVIGRYSPSPIRFFNGMIDEIAVYNFALSPAQVAAHYAAMTNKSGSYRAAVLADNPVSYWRLGEASGTVAADDMGVNPGTYVGGVTLGVAGALDDGHDGEMITRYKGYLDEVEFITEERPKVRMRFVSRAKRAIERTLGSDAFPLDYSASAYNPADLAWDLLTTRAGLDATASIANVDIDYTSWLNYKTICTELTFSFKAYFTGQSISESLRLIGELTDSIIFGETSGKFYFKKFFPEESASYYTFDEANAHMQAARMYFNKARIINKAKVWYGYNPSTQAWAGSVTKENATSQTNYSLQGREYNNAGIWHNDLNSATAFGERQVGRYTDPIETAVTQTKPGTQAMIHQIGDNIQMTWSQMDLAAQKMKIYGLTGELTPGTYEITAEDLVALNKNFFIIDSSVNGVLDVNVLA